MKPPRRAARREIRRAFAERPEWAAAERELATLLSSDFQESELGELASFMSRPLGEKWNDAQLRLYTRVHSARATPRRQKDDAGV